MCATAGPRRSRRAFNEASDQVNAMIQFGAITCVSDWMCFQLRSTTPKSANVMAADP